MSRADILDRLSISNRSGPPGGGRLNSDKQSGPGHLPEVSPQAQSQSDPIVQFLANWEELGGTWELHDSAVAARLALLLDLQKLDTHELLIWPSAQLPLPDLADALHDLDIEPVLPDRRDINPDLTLGVTSADAALAATGSIVFVPAPDCPWLPALYPIRHIVLLTTSQLYHDLDDWRVSWEAADRSEDLARALIITGPSVSDDIELHPHRGMFGPRYLHLLLIDE